MAPHPAAGQGRRAADQSSAKAGTINHGPDGHHSGALRANPARPPPRRPCIHARDRSLPMVSGGSCSHPETKSDLPASMDSANPLQQLLLRGLGTTTLVADRHCCSRGFGGWRRCCSLRGLCFGLASVAACCLGTLFWPVWPAGSVPAVWPVFSCWRGGGFGSCAFSPPPIGVSGGGWVPLPY